MKHEGRAVVFENAEDLAKRIDADDLDVNAGDVLVLKNIGPKGAPGMPEAGYLPIPKKLARQGVKDMVRISDGRMSGTAAGTIVPTDPRGRDRRPARLVSLATAPPRSRRARAGPPFRHEMARRKKASPSRPRARADNSASSRP